MTIKTFFACLFILMFFACKNEDKSSASKTDTVSATDDTDSFLPCLCLGDDPGPLDSDAARKYIKHYNDSNFYKASNQIVKMKAKQLQHMIKKSKDGYVYFILGGEKIDTSNRIIFLATNQNPSFASSLPTTIYKISEAMCPPPNSPACDISSLFKIVDTTAAPK